MSLKYIYGALSYGLIFRQYVVQLFLNTADVDYWCEYLMQELAEDKVLRISIKLLCHKSCIYPSFLQPVVFLTHAT